MRNYVWRPLIVALIAIALLLVARAIMVPDDFGVHGDSFTYNFYRKDSINDWKKMEVKYQGKAYCVECHEEKVEANLSSPHGIIECENCHGPARNHPDDPELLEIVTKRELCLRCHDSLPYPDSLRGDIIGIDPEEHNPGSECIECHNPHNPDLEDM
ncbi:MAG: cytochrome c3 family protein [Desulfobacterales bacterium]|nr:cytochrome c3 family protein [Desulfobacterales bacterium]